MKRRKHNLPPKIGRSSGQNYTLVHCDSSPMHQRSHNSIIEALRKLNRDQERRPLVRRSHLLLLSLYLSGAIMIGLQLDKLSLLYSTFLSLLFFVLFFSTIVASLLIIRFQEQVRESFYARCSVGSVFAAVLILVLTLAFPLVAPLQMPSSRLYFYAIMFDSLTQTATFLLFYSKGYPPSSTIESLKIEVTVNLQMLYLFCWVL